MGGNIEKYCLFCTLLRIEESLIFISFNKLRLNYFSFCSLETTTFKIMTKIILTRRTPLHIT